jgi:DNA-3-methyladenine glycosylase II
LAVADPDLAGIIEQYDYPPLWSRPNNYETLVHIILEQQVSLASAKAALEKLRAKTHTITPENVLLLNDEELKACYVSRQKIVYVRGLAEALVKGDLILGRLESLSDDEVRARLIQLKGFGNWTADIYLIMVLHRTNIFPLGDLAAVNALKRLKKLPKDTPPRTVTTITDNWQPYRTIATMLLWHYYLSTRLKAM